MRVSRILKSLQITITLFFLLSAMALSSKAQISRQQILAGQMQGTSAARQRSRLISSAYVDIDGDGRKERVEMRVNSGKLIEAEEDSCLSFRKYEGQFAIVVWIEGKPVEHSLNALWGNAAEAMFFHSEPFRLGFHDYNHDGQPDFNLGQYENCNGWSYKLFTIARDGKITLLKIEGIDGGLYVQAADNSTAEISETRSGFSQKAYDNADDRCMPCTKVFVWNKDKQVFKLARKIPATN